MMLGRLKYLLGSITPNGGRYKIEADCEVRTYQQIKSFQGFLVYIKNECIFAM